MAATASSSHTGGISMENLAPTTDDTSHMESFLRVLVELKHFSDEYGDNSYQVPYFVTMGTQSAGKTTFIDYFVKLAVGFTSEGIATVCPVKYELVFDPNITGDPQVWFQGSSIPPTDLPARVERHMKDIKQTEGENKVSDQELNVRIMSAHVADFVFVDLPGFNIKEQELTESIHNLAKTYMAKPETFVLGIVKSTENLDSNLEVGELLKMCKDAGYNPKTKMMILANKIDDVGAWKHPDALDDLLFPSNMETDYMYMTLNPENENLSGMSPEERTQHAMDLERKEARWIHDSLVSRISRKSEIESHFYLKNISKVMVRKLFRSFDKVLSSIITKLSQSKDDLKRRIAEIGKLPNGDPAQVDMLICDRIGSFVSKALSIINMGKVQKSPYSNAVEMPEDRRHKLENIIGTTMEQDNDILQGGAKIWQHLLSPKEMSDHMYQQKEKGTYLQLRNDSKATGPGAFERIKRQIEYSMLVRKETGFADSTIESAFESGYYRKTDVDKAVGFMVESQILDCKDAIEAFTMMIRSLCQKYAGHALNELFHSERSGEGEDLLPNELWADISEAFMSYVNDTCLHAMTKRWNESISMYSSYMPFDISVRTLLFLLNCSMEDMIVNPKQTKERILQRTMDATSAPQVVTDGTPEVCDQVDAAVAELKAARRKHSVKEADAADPGEDTEQPHVNFVAKLFPEVKKQLANLGLADTDDTIVSKMIGGVMSNDFENIANELRRLLARKLNEANAASLSEAEKKQKEVRREIEKRSHRKMERLEQIRSQIRSMKEEFTIADIVEGGFQAPKHQTASSINLDYVRAVTSEYYYMVLTRFLTEFDINFHANFRNNLSQTKVFDIIMHVKDILMKPVKLCDDEDQYGLQQHDQSSVFEKMRDVVQERCDGARQEKAKLIQKHRDITEVLRKVTSLRAEAA